MKNIHYFGRQGIGTKYFSLYQNVDGFKFSLKIRNQYGGGYSFDGFGFYLRISKLDEIRLNSDRNPKTFLLNKNITVKALEDIEHS